MVNTKYISKYTFALNRFKLSGQLKIKFLRTRNISLDEVIT